MSNEIQLASNPGGPPAYPAPWLGGALGAPAAGGGQPGTEQTVIKKVHRLLRGRYLLAVVLGLLGAAGGAVGGFMSQKPAYRSDGLIEIDPRVVRLQDVDRVMVLTGQYVQSQMLKLKSEQVVRAALQDPKLRSVLPNVKWHSQEAVTQEIAKFGSNLTVTVPPRSQNFIQISWGDIGPDARRVAPVAVASVLSAYRDLFSNQDTQVLNDKIERLKRDRDRLDREIESKRKSIDDWSKDGGDDPTGTQARSENVAQLDRNLQTAQLTLAEAEQLAANPSQQATPEDWARVDQKMATYVTLKNSCVLQKQELNAQLGPNHPAVIAKVNELQVLDEYIGTYAKDLNNRFLIKWKEDGTGWTLIPRDLSGLKRAVEQYGARLKIETDKVNAMRRAAREINVLREDIAQARAKATVAETDYNELVFQKEYLGPGRIKIISTGDIAVLDKDKRPMYAALGFMGGAGLPIGLLMLIGLLDSRYRFSDESAPSASGLNLLGILPNLPDRLSDPEQAAIAAHCVHQIRTMLQINGGTEDRRVFAITSASPGDGKTSLTLALGLSYAACGTRTLLIDCDLIGAGLTSRMNVSAAEGVLEAIANRSMLPYIRQTDVADVALLPVGSAGNLHASTLSPAALRRLIEEAEKNFETILIDTGPILGSIEASLVCAAADAVILTVARGQQRPVVEKSLSHLVAIGARLAGVVFNRAQASDFERSISGVSMRSVGVHGPRTNGNGSRLGPVARSVVPESHFADAEHGGSGDRGVS